MVWLLALPGCAKLLLSFPQPPAVRRVFTCQLKFEDITACEYSGSSQICASSWFDQDLPALAGRNFFSRSLSSLNSRAPAARLRARRTCGRCTREVCCREVAAVP